MTDTEKAIIVWEIYGCFRSNLKKINPKTEHLQFSSRESMEEWKRNNPDFWIIAETEEDAQ